MPVGWIHWIVIAISESTFCELCLISLNRPHNNEYEISLALMNLTIGESVFRSHFHYIYLTFPINKHLCVNIVSVRITVSILYWIWIITKSFLFHLSFSLAFSTFLGKTCAAISRQTHAHLMYKNIIIIWLTQFQG